MNLDRHWNDDDLELDDRNSNSLFPHTLNFVARLVVDSNLVLIFDGACDVVQGYLIQKFQTWRSRALKLHKLEKCPSRLITSWIRFGGQLIGRQSIPLQHSPLWFLSFMMHQTMPHPLLRTHSQSRCITHCGCGGHFWNCNRQIDSLVWLSSWTLLVQPVSRPLVSLAFSLQFIWKFLLLLQSRAFEFLIFLQAFSVDTNHFRKFTIHENRIKFTFHFGKGK